MDRFIHFDSDTGVLRCESGITLYEILKLVVPQGWFLPCTPGTGFATLGGALANDVHGKNHHTSGSFGDHVRAFELVRSTDESLMCTPDTNPELFRATIGGLGLTGLVTWIEIQLAPIRNAWLWTESHRFENLGAFWPLNAEAEQRWPYTVAWIDCLAKGSAQGRGVLFCGQHAAAQSDWPVYRQRQRKFPVMPPVSLVNHLSLRSFNAAYFRQPVYPEGKVSHFIPYFYPLDGIQNWNRIYGRRGFFQYQCVIPPENAQSGIPHLLSAIANSGQGSFLAVLKSFGNRAAPGLLSFSRPGTTLALDFPNKGDITQALLMRLDEIVAEAGGALYPAKDARMPAWMFRASYPQWESFTQYVDPAFKSHFWKRVTS
jgi:FAD/FMN-containing dehydrogenase